MKTTGIKLALMLFLSLSPGIIAYVQASAAPLAVNSHADTLKTAILLNRLEEIRAMDKSDLSFSEKRALRKEVRDIKGQLKSQGFLLTVGLIAVIAMLLMIILDPFNK